MQAHPELKTYFGNSGGQAQATMLANHGFAIWDVVCGHGELYRPFGLAAVTELVKRHFGLAPEARFRSRKKSQYCAISSAQSEKIY